MNCAELRFLIDVHSDPNLDPADVSRFADVLSKWRSDGLVKKDGETIFSTTDKGSAWIKMILATPQPIEVFVDPRDRKEP